MIHGAVSSALRANDVPELFKQYLDFQFLEEYVGYEQYEFVKSEGFNNQLPICANTILLIYIGELNLLRNFVEELDELDLLHDRKLKELSSTHYSGSHLIDSFLLHSSLSRVLKFKLFLFLPIGFAIDYKENNRPFSIDARDLKELIDNRIIGVDIRQDNSNNQSLFRTWKMKNSDQLLNSQKLPYKQIRNVYRKMPISIRNYVKGMFS